jgi:hypothetical protein
MAVTLSNSTFRDFDVQILTDTIRSVFAGKDAFMGSVLASSGGVTVNDQMPVSDPDFIGSEITIPYFGTIGEFVDNPEGSSITPNSQHVTNEKATVGRMSLGFEVSRWARNAAPDDPYQEAARSALVSATRAMDKAIIDVAAATPLVRDIYAASGVTAANNIGWNAVCDARALWGDEDQDAVAMVAHSRTINDMRKLVDNQGRPLLVESMQQSNVDRFCGLPLVISDRMPLTGSTMPTATAGGTTPPALTIGGSPTGPWSLRIVPVVAGAVGTGSVKFSVDGGNTYSDPFVPAAGVPYTLTDTAKDSLIGNNGKTGLTVSFAAGTFNANNTYVSVANLKVTSLIVRKGALAYWYNRNALTLLTDQNINADTNMAALHLYHAPKLYRRARGATKPGVIAIKHNVSGYSVP